MKRIVDAECVDNKSIVGCRSSCNQVPGYIGRESTLGLFNVNCGRPITRGIRWCIREDDLKSLAKELLRRKWELYLFENESELLRWLAELAEEK